MYGEFCHLEPELSGCNKKVAALHVQWPQYIVCFSLLC